MIYKTCNKLFFFIILFISLSQASDSQVISWKSEEGMARLSSSMHKTSFFDLAINFEPQANSFYCSVASATIVLNTLRARDSWKKSRDSIISWGGGIKPIKCMAYTQGVVLQESRKPLSVVFGKSKVHVQGQLKFDKGFQIHQLTELLQAHGLIVEKYIADEKIDDANIKSILIDNLKTVENYIIINYHRSSLGQAGAGHTSVLAAYHEPSDSFLIMDTSTYKLDWVWANSDILIKSMRTFDLIENRGFILVREGDFKNNVTIPTP